MDKAPDAFRTISEVAEELDIPQHVLRFWETRFAQIKPMKRSGGRRYYRPDDVDLRVHHPPVERDVVLLVLQRQRHPDLDAGKLEVPPQQALPAKGVKQRDPAHHRREHQRQQRYRHVAADGDQLLGKQRVRAEGPSLD